MSPTDPQFLYFILVLPVLFGIVLIAEGIKRNKKKEQSGLVAIVVGVVFLILTVLFYYFISTSLGKRL